MKSDRVTLRADDAMTAFSSLRTSIKGLDEILASDRDMPPLSRAAFQKYRDQDVEAYQRIAKALGVQPTLDKAGERKSA